MHRRLVLPVVLFAAALAACSAPQPTGASGAAPATRLAEPDHTVLSANSTAKLGTVVIDGLGWTLYRFDADSATPPRSACTGSCAEQWPPVADPHFRRRSHRGGCPERPDPSIDDASARRRIAAWRRMEKGASP